MCRNLVTILLILITFVMSACTGSGSKDKTETSTQKDQAIHFVKVSGRAGDQPLSEAEVKVFNTENELVAKTTTNQFGMYSAEIPVEVKNAGYILEVSGGKLNNKEFKGTMRGVFTKEDSVEKTNVNALSSLIYDLSKGEEGVEDIIENRKATLLKLTEYQMLSESDWKNGESEYVNVKRISSYINSNSFNSWLEKIKSDLADEELDKRNLVYFPNAHGGLLSAETLKKNISIFPEQTIELDIHAEFINKNKSISTKKVEGPEWISVMENTIVITPPSNINDTNRTYSAEFKSFANGSKLGRSFSIEVFIPQPITIVSGVLSESGGSIESKFKDVTLSIKPNRLDKEYRVEYVVGLGINDVVHEWVKTTPELTKEIYFKVEKPSDESIHHNYIKNHDLKKSSQHNDNVTENKTYAAKRSLDGGIYSASVNINTYPLFASAVDRACRPDEKSDSKNEMVWKYGMPYVLQGREAYFSKITKIISSVTGGAARLQDGYTSDEKLCATALRSEHSIYKDIQGKEAVILIHGFVNTGKLGGYDKGNSIDDEAYFGKLPKILKSKKNSDGIHQHYIPFVFQWRTNAKFEDVALDLALAIELLAQKTGRKVHLIAHSYGGLLARTFLQGKAGTAPYNTTEFIEQHTASLTTVGTPHSGTRGDAGSFEFSNTVFPEGRHGFFGALIEQCRAITCYQTGSPLEMDEFSSPEGQDYFGTNAHGGKLIDSLYESLVEYPSINTQILIGLAPESLKVEYIDNKSYGISYDFFYDDADVNPGAGDNLISIFGQRLIPDSDQSDLDPLSSDGYIVEHILPMDTRLESFVSGVDDGLTEKYDAKNKFWNIGNYNTDKYYRANIKPKDLSKFANGYYHRTGEYKTNIDEVCSKHQFNYETQKEECVEYTELYSLSEVGLQNCSDSENCNHGTWRYLNKFLDENPAGFLDGRSLVNLSGSINLIDKNSEQSPVNFEVSLGIYHYSSNGLSSLIKTIKTSNDGSYSTTLNLYPNELYYIEAIPASKVQISSKKSKQFSILAGAESLIVPPISLLKFDPEDPKPVPVKLIKPTNEWFGQVVYSANKKYYERAHRFIKDSRLHIPASSIFDNYYWTRFGLQHDFNISGDDFTLEVRFKVPRSEGGISCFDPSFSVVGENNSRAQVVYMSPDCTVFSSIGAADFYHVQRPCNDNKCKSVSLASLGQNFDDWRVVKLVVKDMRVTTYFDGEEKYSMEYKGTVGNIRLINLSFKGSGSADWVKLYNGDDDLVFIDEFDR